VKSFRFPLENALRWRRSQLELEEFKLKRMIAELQQLETLRRQLRTDGVTARANLVKATTIDGHELAELSSYLLHLSKSEDNLVRRRSDQQRRIGEQQRRLLDARRRLRLIEKLKQRRFSEWQYELNREIETFAAEAYLAQWNKRAHSS
jgi:flagellar export protein FliJ